ncbi:inositol monophosphatase 3-like [Saccoglossus kowalevskii]|uniref:inositol-phosphate phosphatase n=1 Tax=Saccoglossus kowalevskii TaxID=10224 RepID=A0ABM0GUF2_SACKO|nr:PREDICTED: inositol monophosphatase 3-like [Saccoglossus kowalevskii]
MAPKHSNGQTTSNTMFERKMAQVRLSPVGIAVILVFLLAGVLYIHRKVSANRSVDSTDAKYDSAEGTVPQSINLRELLSTAIVVARRGGDIVKEIRLANTLDEKSKGETREGANNPVTEGDMKSHIAMYYGLKKAFPNLKVISEEHDSGVDTTGVETPNKELPEVSNAIGTDDYVPIEKIAVWIDPLDATQEYTENLVQYVTTMVCVAVDGQPVMGVIHKPFEDKTAWAWVGKGASGYKLPPTKPDSAAKNIIVSRSHSGDVEKVVKESFGEQSTVIPAGGAGYKVWSLFDEIADAYVHVTLIKKWDICAGNALLNHQNGIMTDLEGQKIDYSATSDPKNEFGLLATLHDHNTYLKNLRPAYEALKKS